MTPIRSAASHPLCVVMIFSFLLFAVSKRSSGTPLMVMRMCTTRGCSHSCRRCYLCSYTYKAFPPLTLSPLASHSCFPVPLVRLRLMNITVRGYGEKYKNLTVCVQHSNVWIVRWCNDESESPVSVSFTFSNSRCKNRCNYAAVVMCERFSPLDWWLRVIPVCVGRVFWPAEIVKALPE